MVVILALVGSALAVDADGDGWQAGPDCDDYNLNVHPFAFEVVGNNVDEDCNGREMCYVDNDNDGARTSATMISNDTDCLDPFEAVSSDPIDCGPSDPQIHPGATEIPGDEVDQNCDGQELCYHDNDADGFGGSNIINSPDLLCDTLIESTVTGDCDDGNPDIHPGATEIPGDVFDQDCDGHELCYLDLDEDGSRSELIVESSDPYCLDPYEAWVFAPIDCDDADPDRYPGAVELCDGVDNNCDGDADSIELLPAVPAVAGGVNSWDLIGGPPSSTARLVVSPDLGETEVVPCPGLFYDLGNARRIGSATSDLDGDATLSGTVAAGAAGRIIYAQALFPATCELSCVVETQF